MLSIGRALMARPKLLLLDEPSMGLAPMVAQEIFQVIENLIQGKENNYSSGRTKCAGSAEVGQSRLCAGNRPIDSGRNCCRLIRK